MFFLMLMVLGCIGFFYGFQTAGKLGGFVGVVIGALAGGVAYVLIRVVTGGSGGIAGSLFSGRRPSWSLREQLGGTLSQARHYKGKNKMDDALRKVNEVLEQDPVYPEALLLKAQIMWEGYDNLDAAKKYLLTALTKTPKDDFSRGRIESFYRELVRIEKIRKNPPSPSESDG